MITLKASNGKWLAVAGDGGEGDDTGGPGVVASRADDPHLASDWHGARFRVLPASTEPWWSSLKHADRPPLVSGTKLRIYAPARRYVEDRLLSTSGGTVTSPARLRARLMDRNVRPNFLLGRFETDFTVKKVDPEGLVVIPGPIRNGDSVALMQSRATYLHADPVSGAITPGSDRIGPDELFEIHSGADLGVRLELHLEADDAVHHIVLTVVDSYTRAPIPASFQLPSPPFGVGGTYEANTWIDVTLGWEWQETAIPLTVDVVEGIDPWSSQLTLDWAAGQEPEWLAGEDGIKPFPWR